MALSTGSPTHGRAHSRPLLDAVAFLEVHHRRLERLLSRFMRTRNRERKAELAAKICSSAVVHARLEKEIFCPAFLAATGNLELHHHAEVTRDTCIMLIAAFGGTDKRDAHLEARMQVVTEVIRRHIQQEEKRDGMFAAARNANMDLLTLGHRMRHGRYVLAKGRTPSRPLRHARPAAMATH